MKPRCKTTCCCPFRHQRLLNFLDLKIACAMEEPQTVPCVATQSLTPWRSPPSKATSPQKLAPNKHRPTQHALSFNRHQQTCNKHTQYPICKPFRHKELWPITHATTFASQCCRINHNNAEETCIATRHAHRNSAPKLSMSQRTGPQALHSPPTG